MPEWIHRRAEHLLAKNPSMKKSTAFAVATQQGEAMGKTPKGFGTAKGKRIAKRKYDTPKDDVHTANPGGLDSPKLAAVPQGTGKKFWEAAKAELGPAMGAVLGAGTANVFGVNPLAGAAAGYGLGALPEVIHGIRHRTPLGGAPVASPKMAAMRQELIELTLHKQADMIPGGKADKQTDADFPKAQLAMGQKVEMEHTDDPKKAQEIARDHLSEFKDYYTRLKKMEGEAKKGE